MQKAGGTWVVGDRFFDREAELEACTLLTAQRQMGKTPAERQRAVRGDLRRLGECRNAGGLGCRDRVPVDSDAGRVEPDQAVVRKRPATRRGAHTRILGMNLKVKLRAGVDAGNWRHMEAAITGGRLSGDAIARQRKRQASEANPVSESTTLGSLATMNWWRRSAYARANPSRWWRCCAAAPATRIRTKSSSARARRA